MADKGDRKDKDKKEQQRDAKRTLKERRKLKKEKKIQGAFTMRTNDAAPKGEMVASCLRWA